MAELREYQKELLDKIRDEIKNNKHSIACVIGCGGGKSYILAELIRSATSRGNNVLFLVHRVELLDQIRQTLLDFGVDMDLCECLMVQTATRRIKKLKTPDIIVIDEFHHAPSRSYVNIFEAFPLALRVGFTATPQRLDTGGLGDVCDSIVEGKSTEWLIENGYLSPYKVFSVRLVDTSNLHSKMGDFDKVELAELMENKNIYGNIYDNWKRLADGKQTIIYCASIKQSKETIATFISEGVVAAHIDGTTPKAERDSLMQGFRDGKITVLSNVDLFGEGISVDNCACVCLARPTQSLTLFIQQSLRPCRYQEGKTAIILDFVGNTIRHGFPSDDREWTLEVKRKKTKSEVHILECPECYAVSRAGTVICPNCGYDFKDENNKIEKKRKDKVIKEYELQELEKLSKMGIDEVNFSTWEDIERFRKAHKYNPFWAVRKALALNIDVPRKNLYIYKKFGGGKR